MRVSRIENLALAGQSDLILVRQTVRSRMAEMHFSLVDQTKMVTAASELARNLVLYGGGGTMRLEELAGSEQVGIRLVFEDHGPGIPDIELALQDGYSTGDGLGLGLGGARRLVNEFEIESMVGQGTKVTVARWR